MDGLAEPSVTSRKENGQLVVTPAGDWTIETIGDVVSEMRRLQRSNDHGKTVIDLSGLGRIDTAGAFLLSRSVYNCETPTAQWHFRGTHPTAQSLIDDVIAHSGECTPDVNTSRFGFVRAAERIGVGLEGAWREAVTTFAFLGKTIMVFIATLARPWRFRITPIFHVMEEAGVNALPIVAVLSFFIGAVVAYMGANLLETFGASVFTVELVGLAVLREFGVLITAIMLAGRSDSAFTAAIGSMKMQQEIDAMRVLGIDPYEALVLPRVIACVIMTPLLAFAAVIAGLLGGLLVSWSALGISPDFFVSRLRDTIDISHFWVGMSKAPIFGLIIAIVGCKQGLEVGGDVESLGRHVTASVVQSIFAVIIVDAIFAMMYLELNI